MVSVGISNIEGIETISSNLRWLDIHTPGCQIMIKIQNIRTAKVYDYVSMIRIAKYFTLKGPLIFLKDGIEH